MFNFPLTKSSQQRKTARHCKTPMKSNIVSIGSYVWLFLLDFAQTEIACWNSACLNKLEQFLVSFTRRNVSILRLFHMVSWGCCENTFAAVQNLSSRCLPSVYGIEPGFSNYVSPQMGSRNVILSLRNQLAWQIRYNNFCKIYKKIESRPAVNLFLLHFYF